MTTPPALLERVSRSFGGTVALAGVDLTVGAGEIVSLLGPNGAGKTTALRILLGLRRPDAGRAAIFGRDPCTLESRRRLGCTPQETSLPPTLTVRETVDLVRRHFPRPPRSDELLERFGLSADACRQTGGLSGGRRRRLAVALAFAGGADLLVLDEPTSGLDAEARRLVWDAVRAHAARGGAVLLTTHHLEEAEALATRVAVLARGRIRIDGTAAEIRARAGLTRVRLVTATIEPVPGEIRRERACGVTTLYVRDVASALRRLVSCGVPLAGLEVAPATLEEALTLLGVDG